MRIIKYETEDSSIEVNPTNDNGINIIVSYHNDEEIEHRNIVLDGEDALLFIEDLKGLL